MDRIKELLKADPWRPFSVRAQSRIIRVPTRQHAWVSPHGRIVIETSANSLEVIAPEQFEGLDIDPWSDHEVC
jgi:hypothetical protein